MTDVFISYSRKDKAFVQTLHEALKANDRNTWVDWENIPSLPTGGTKFSAVLKGHRRLRLSLALTLLRLRSAETKLTMRSLTTTLGADRSP